AASDVYKRQESELSMVYHRHIRSAVVRKVISLLNTAER
ncbi:hypothetical protein MX747_23530, partial [Klebsiella pneumoniae]|nr:hypothetical protein [Klebsiella pneumoniae]